MKVKQIEINIGAEKPFSVYHITDNHISLADERDSAKIGLARNRANAFTNGNPGIQIKQTKEILEIINEEPLPVIHTGDFVDFVSKANYEFAEDFFKKTKAFVSAGNHEFSQFVGEAFEDEKYKNQSLEIAEKSLGVGIEFGVHYIENVKFITLDNSYYYVTEQQLASLKCELSDGIKTVLCVHTPLYSEDLYSKVTFGKPDDEPPYLIGVPYDKLLSLSGDRFRQQVADRSTLSFIEICNKSKNLKAVLSGHLHKEYVSHLDCGTFQIAADAAYNGVIYRYNFV